MSELIGKYIEATKRRCPKSRKTDVWVLNAAEEVEIGYVAWNPPWRQYVFVPAAHTIYHDGCLRDIADFLERKNKAHKQQLRRRKGKR